MSRRPPAGRAPHHVSPALVEQPWAFPDVHLRVSSRADGDFHIEQPTAALDATRRRLVDLPWTQPDEVHGTAVGVVQRPGALDRAVLDALVTDCAGAVLGIWVGDCAPVAFAAEHEDASGRRTVRVGAAHAGWRGLLDGVLAETVVAMRAVPSGAVAVGPLMAVLGPCIHPCCYEFGDDDLARAIERFGPTVEGRTADGRRALDVPTAVRLALAELDVALDDRSACTGCDADRWFSHRVRRERGRQVMAVWKDAPMDLTAHSDGDDHRSAGAAR